MTFNEWLAKVDGVIASRIGLSHNDLMDQTWYDWYEDGMSPADAAHEAILAEAEDMAFLFGGDFDIDDLMEVL